MTIGAACCVAYRYGIFDSLLEACGIEATRFTRVAATIGAFFATNYVAGSLFTGLWTNLIDKIAMPIITRGNYNPWHTKPIGAAETLKGKLKCPVLIHQSYNDGVLADPNKDTVRLYRALRNGNENKTHILLTKDGNHNWPSPKHETIKGLWKAYYKNKASNQPEWVKETRPEVADLRAQVAPNFWDWIGWKS